MSIAGVRQLKTLIVRYCEYGGSSKGARMFIETQLPKIKEDNPDLKVRVEKVNGKHPILVGQYRMCSR
ncbi:MAG: hypothetical protein Q8P67_11885 [archaeon]|nr:hypothetical protein [archaeon]